MEFIYNSIHMNASSFIDLVEELEKEAIKQYPSTDKPFSLPEYISNLNSNGRITFEDFNNFKYIWQLRNKYLSNKTNLELESDDASKIAIYLREKIQ